MTHPSHSRPNDRRCSTTERKELRKLHDNLQQHVRALKTLGCDLRGTFITSMIELKLDVDTLFEWQKHSQRKTGVPHYDDLLKFLDLRAQASETSCTTHKKKPPSRVASFTAHAHSNCVVSKTESIRCTFVPISHLFLMTRSPCSRPTILFQLSHRWALQTTMQVSTQVQGVPETTPHSPAH